MEDDPVGCLCLVDDVGQDGLGVGRIHQLPFQKSGHHLDSRKRVLDFVRDRSRHFAQRRKAITQTLTFLELLDTRQILKEQDGAGDTGIVVEDPREGEADHFARLAQS